MPLPFNDQAVNLHVPSLHMKTYQAMNMHHSGVLISLTVAAMARNLAARDYNCYNRADVSLNAAERSRVALKAALPDTL